MGAIKPKGRGSAPPWLPFILGGVLLLEAANAAPTGGQPSPSANGWPVATSQACVGERYKHRACHFHNLVFDKEEQVFVYHTTAAAVEQLGLEPGVVTRTYLVLGLGNMRNLHIRPEDAFPIRFVTDAFPSSNESCVNAEPIFLYSPFRHASFGHMLRDNHHNIVDNLFRLGLQSTPRKLLVVSPHRVTIPNTVEHYKSYVASAVNTLANETSRCDKRYVVFSDFAAGNGVKRNLRWHELPQGRCAPKYFRQQRDTAFRFSRLPPPRPVDPQNVRVLILDRDLGDRRRIMNIPDLLPALRQRFPSFAIDSVMLSRLSPREQLMQLANTTIFITTIGSASFRLIFLPDGAHVILVGAPQLAQFPQADKAFREADACWDNMRYIKVDRYRITEPDEFQIRATRKKFIENKGKYEAFMWWDADSRLNATKLGDIIERGVKSIRARQTG